MQGLGKCVPGVTGLLYVEGHVDRLRLASPLAVHLPACELFFQPVLVDPQEIGRKSQNYTKQNKTWLSFRFLTIPLTNTQRHVCVHMPDTNHHEPPRSFTVMKTAYQKPHTHPSTLIFPNFSITWVNSYDDQDFQLYKSVIQEGRQINPPYWDHSQMPQMDIFPRLQQDSLEGTKWSNIFLAPNTVFLPFWYSVFIESSFPAWSTWYHQTYNDNKSHSYWVSTQYHVLGY